MRRSSHTIFKNIMILGATMSLSACNGMFEGIYDDPIESEMEIKESSFSQINTTEYTNWVYIDLSERKATTVEIGEEHKSEIPAEWDLAIHRYDIKTNEGAAYQTTYTNIDELKASGKLPAEENFIKDEWTTNAGSETPIYTMSNQVYLIRLKDNTYAAIRFTNYTNARGIKGYIDFDFLYPLDFEENN